LRPPPPRPTLFPYTTLFRSQGLLMCAVDLSAIPLMAELLGMPFEVALAVVVLNGLFYLTHHLLGDPVVPGWITPAVPLIMAYCSDRKSTRLNSSHVKISSAV